jgi:hypothetical protein
MMALALVSTIGFDPMGDTWYEPARAQGVLSPVFLAQPPLESRNRLLPFSGGFII